MTFTCNNTLNEGRCETWHHIRIHSMKGGVRLWCETWHHIRIHSETWHHIRKYSMKAGVRLRCETWHHNHIRIYSMKGAVRLWWDCCVRLTSHNNTNCMNECCMLCAVGSRSTKPCVFPCKVAAASDERYLVCAAVAAGLVLVPPVFCNKWLLLCA